MRWFDTPPCPSYEVTTSTPERLLLSGPSRAQRLAGGATAAFGSVFAGMGLRIARLPMPAPFKLVPLAFAAIGGGVTALGGAAALAQASLEVSRDALVLKWKLPGLPEKERRLATRDLAALEITTHAHEGSELGSAHRVYEHRLVVVTKDGAAVELESFGTRTQAELRQRAVEAIIHA
ncbi:MAG: hypothetical protein ACOZQL_15280 [Myxococcota bacterium]